MVNKCTNKACAEDKKCYKNLNNQVGVRLLCKQIVNAVDTPAEENQTNQSSNHNCNVFSLC